MRPTFLIQILFLFVMLIGCKNGAVNSGENPFIFTHTSGQISKKHPIKVVFNHDIVKASNVGMPVESAAINISPSIEGSATWIDTKTLEFKPDYYFESDKKYHITINIDKLFKVSSSQFEHFEFEISTIKQDFEIKWIGWETPNSTHYENQNFVGKIITHDFVEDTELQKMIQASQNNKNLSIHIRTKIKPNEHLFVVSNIERKDRIQHFEVKIDGKALQIIKKETQKFNVLPLDSFQVFKVETFDHEDHLLRINFSDPLLENQNLAGLVQINNSNGVLTYKVEKNNLLVYTSEKLTGKHIVTIQSNILNSNEKSLHKNWTQEVEFPEINPRVKFTSVGNILPGNDQLILPFEAINLKAIDVEIVKIYANNLLQFYQTYNWFNDESYEMERVGNIVFQKKIDLTSINSTSNKSHWVSYGLDLKKFINEDQNAIYHVRIGFRRAYTTVSCRSDKDDPEKKLEPYSETYGESVESIFDNNYDGFGDHYSWEERDNPCNTSYYNQSKFIAKSIYRSSIGLIVKGNSQGSYFVAATDLKTANPNPGVELTFYDYQQQEIGKINTNQVGIGQIALKKIPFLVSGKKGEETSYLALGDPYALNMSKFDVGGDGVLKGLKAFIYGERGIWRPGDSIFLNCIVQQQSQNMPPEMPMTITFKNPEGVVILSKTLIYKKNQIQPVPLKTNENDLTGTYTVNIKVGGSQFSKNIFIETIKPNRLKIDVTMNENEMELGSLNLKGSIKSNWLMGSPSSGLKTVIEASFSNVQDPFPKWKDFVFGYKKNQLESDLKIFDGKLDNHGNLLFSKDLRKYVPNNDVVSMFLKTTIFEDGGNSSVNYKNFKISPKAKYVGLKIPKNEWESPCIPISKASKIDVLTCTASGKLISNQEVEINIYEVNWNWWWENSGYDYYQYNGDYTQKKIKKINLKTNSSGLANFSFTPQSWGRFLILVNLKGEEMVAGGYVYAGYPDDASTYDINSMNTGLKISLENEEVSIGSEINLSFNSPEGANALITIESAQEVLSSQWIKCKKGITTHAIKATHQMGANCYVHVSLIQPYEKNKNDLPLRMFGVLPVKIKNPNLYLQPIITSAIEARPNENVDIKISEKSGKQMQYTLAIVDEGLLDITNFCTPSPYQYFYSKNALAIKTWDLFDHVLGKKLSNLSGVFAVGGDANLKQNKALESVSRFKPTVINLGPFNLGKNSTKKHKINIKDYIGSVRVMVVCVNEQSYGQAQKEMKVNREIMTASTLPRRLSPGEELLMPINIFVTKNAIKEVEVKFEDQNHLIISKQSNSQKVKIDNPGDFLVYFPVKVAQKEGVSKVKIITTAKGFKAFEEIIEIEIKNVLQPIYNTRTFQIEAGKSVEVAYSPIGSPNTNFANLELSSLPAMGIEKNIKYLLEFPYGCLEQTVSKAFPQLYLNQYFPLNEERKKQVKAQIETVIRNLSRFQKANGGFSTWPTQNEIDAFATSYVGHFMIEAKKNGFVVPQNVYSNWLRFEQKLVKAWNPKLEDLGLFNRENSSSQAYNLFVLSLTDSPDLNAMNLLKGRKKLTNRAKILLSASYGNVGKKDVGNGILKNIDSTQDEFDSYYASQMSDQAYLLYTSMLLNQKNNSHLIAKELANKLSLGSEYSTFDRSIGLWAMSNYVKNFPPSQNILSTITIDGKKVKINEKSGLFQMVLNANKSGKYIITNQSKGTLYVSLNQRGKPSKEPLQKIENNLILSVKYYDINNKEIQPVKLKKGTIFYVEATTSTNQNVNSIIPQIALNQIFPSGWEIVNDRSMNNNEEPQNQSIAYQDFRDDRVYTYFDGIIKRPFPVVRIKLIASYKGKFFYTGAEASSLYLANFRARLPGQWIEVI